MEREKREASALGVARAVVPTISSVAHLFRLAALELLAEPSPSTYSYISAGREIWDQKLWEQLCGLRSLAASGADVRAARARLLAIARRRPPLWEECCGSAELFTYGALCWAQWRGPCLDTHVSLERLREYLFAHHDQSHFGQAALQTALQRLPPRALLREAARNDAVLCFPSARLPVDRRVYREQMELAEVVRRWWHDREPRLLLYQAPPSGGKTSSVALVATLLSAERAVCSAYVIYACRGLSVHTHLCLHLKAGGISYARASALFDGPQLRFETASGAALVAAPELKEFLNFWPKRLGARPLVLVCDLDAAKAVCELRVDDALFFDESCLSAGPEEQRQALLASAPRFLALMSSTLPDQAWLSSCVRQQKQRWPTVQCLYMTSRRLLQSITAYLPDGSVVMPHHFAVPAPVLRQQQHLARFYSAAALEALLQEESLDADVTLEREDVLSHRSIRRVCMDLVASGKAQRRRGNEPRADDREHWIGRAWDLALEAKGLSLMYARDVMECLRQGRAAWPAPRGAYQRIPEDIAACSLLKEAAERGVMAFASEDGRAGEALRAYNRWAYSRALAGEARCVVIGSDAVYGIHLPVLRIVMHDVPVPYEAAIHLCGRTARRTATQEASVFFGSEADAAQAMVPPVGYGAGDVQPVPAPQKA
jgi:hypothetical protein